MCGIKSTSPFFSIFPRLRNEDGSDSIDNLLPPPLQNCSSYHSDGSRTACDLQGHANQIILFFFKGMLNNEPVTTKNSSSIYFECMRQVDRPLQVFYQNSVEIHRASPFGLQVIREVAPQSFLGNVLAVSVVWRCVWVGVCIVCLSVCVYVLVQYGL